MVEEMKRVAGLDLELTVEERNLLSVAYKNVIGNLRFLLFWSVFRIRIILMRIWIRGSASGMMDPDPGPVLDLDPT